MQVPLYVPYVSGQEETYISEAIASRKLDGPDGPFARRASGLLEQVTGSPHALLTPSCTHALEMTALLLDLEPGDEVIMPSFTFAPTATAYALRGATLVYVDCRPDTLNLDERLLESAITERTKAIVVVHYAGVACEMDEILRIADRYQLPVVEDTAHGLAGTYRGRGLGSLGTMGALSFQQTKNIQCGEGGALLLNDPDLLERATTIRDKGTNRNQYFRGEVDKYRWVDLGSSYLMSDMLAAFLAAQLEELPAIQKRRLAIWNTYHAELADWAAANGIKTPIVPAECGHSAHIYYLVLPDMANTDAILAHLREREVKAAIHFLPLHTSPAGVRYGRTAPGGCPIAEQVADNLIRLPMFAAMTDAQLEHTLAALTSYQRI